LKTLNLIRHSNASSGFPGASDIDRPLSDRGETICQSMARDIWRAGCRFKNVFVSPATRAQSTIQLLGKSIDQQEIDWTTDPELYTFSWSELLTWLESRDDKLNTITIVGHNPAISELTIFLTGEQIAQIPPCSYLQIGICIDRWSDIEQNCGQLIESIFPPNQN
jgi:phosphohistidine phosphatase